MEELALKRLVELTDSELDEKNLTLTNEIEALRYELNRVETEIFYRKNPECRPE